MGVIHDSVTESSLIVLSVEVLLAVRPRKPTIFFCFCRKGAMDVEREEIGCKQEVFNEIRDRKIWSEDVRTFSEPF